MIETAKDIYSGNHRINNFSDWFRKWARRDFNPSMFYLGMKLEARINQNRWIVDCPFCKGAEAVWPGELWFLCAGCKNNDSRLAIRVEIPKDQAMIEAVLEKRDNLENRNWAPGESVKDLEKENEDKEVM